MEHIVQFAIGVDDDAIKKNIEENVERKVINDITNDIRDIIFQHSYYSAGITHEPKEWVKEFVRGVVEENKTEIIDAAVAELARNMLRTKAVKDAVAKALEETT